MIDEFLPYARKVADLMMMGFGEMEEEATETRARGGSVHKESVEEQTPTDKLFPRYGGSVCGGGRNWAFFLDVVLCVQHGVQASLSHVHGGGGGGYGVYLSALEVACVHNLNVFHHQNGIFLDLHSSWMWLACSSYLPCRETGHH